MLLALGACGGGGKGPTSLFELAALAPAVAGDELDFYSLPYPNDLRLDPDGTPALARFPRPDAVIGGYIDVIDEHARGFGPTQAAYFRFDAPLDPGTLPDAAGTLTDGAGIQLVDVTPGSAHRGERIPIAASFQPGAIDYIGPDWLALQPVAGFPPREGATYAAIVTDALRGAHGAARAPAALVRVLTDEPRGALEAQAAAVYAPLRAYVAEHPALAGHIAAATVYTTSTGTQLMDALRTAVLATPAPVLGSLAHQSATSAYDLYTARYDAPNFQEGDPPYATTGGAIHLGADGAPVPVRTESLRMAMTVPKGTMPAAGWPVILYAHGTGGDYQSFVADGTAQRFAQVNAKDGTELARFAVLSIDQVLHGPRGTLTPSPDGTSQIDVETAFFNFNNLPAAHDNPKQGALDDFQLLRLAKTIDVPAGAVAVTPIRFDPTKIYFFGHSQGSLTGALYVAAEPELKAAIFSGAGAGLVAGLLHKTQPVDVSALVQSLFRETVDDFHPVLNLLQGYFDDSDPTNYARRYFLEPAPGTAPKSVYISLGLRDSYAPDETITTFALASGVVPVNPVLLPIAALPLTGRSFVDAPQQANVAGGATGVVCEYDPGTHDDGHFVVFDVNAARAQSTRFFGTHAATGTATLSIP